MKKITFTFLVLLMTSILLVSCSKQDDENSKPVNSLKVEGLIGFDMKTKKVYTKEIGEVNNLNFAKENDSLSYETIKYTFICDESMPIFYSQEELESFLLNHTTKTNGVFQLSIDEEVVYTVQIVNGEKFNEEFSETFKDILNKDYPCSYKGIRACVHEGIHNQNWFQMTQCVLEGFGCVAEWYLNCAIDNCPS